MPDNNIDYHTIETNPEFFLEKIRKARETRITLSIKRERAAKIVKELSAEATKEYFAKKLTQIDKALLSADKALDKAATYLRDVFNLE